MMGYRTSSALERPAWQSLLSDFRSELSGAIASDVRVTLWKPNPDIGKVPNPQRLAYESKADILGYGGQAGGGKTDLLLGLAANNHKRSVIFRRTFPQLRDIIERSRQILNPDGDSRSNDSYNESLHRWKLRDGRIIELESCQHEKDKTKQRGRPRDFYGFDEATEFTRTQIEYITAWNRSTDRDQRCRVVLTFNPPSDAEGQWVIGYFLPWLAYLHPDQFNHPKPAKPGELRFYATIDGEEVECNSGDPFEHDGERIEPRSRTFIPATLADNPHLSDTNYRSVLHALPEPLRSQLLYGDFAAAQKIDQWQVIPTEWVKAAQRRWMNCERPNTPLSGVGVDVARGGKDALVIVKRYANYIDEPHKTPGINVEDGPAAAGIIAQQIQNDQHIGYINIDVINVGSSAYDSANAMYPDYAQPVNVAHKSDYVVKGDDGTPLLSMSNLRAEIHWRFREALHPETGNNIALPPGNEIVADLCAARYKVLAGGKIQIESKESIKKRLTRSPDVGEAIMLSWLKSYGEYNKKRKGWAA